MRVRNALGLDSDGVCRWVCLCIFDKKGEKRMEGIQLQSICLPFSGLNWFDYTGR